ncbi:hypothetical protein [Flavobacterium humidisoli]|uniref:TPM domain-containing protein n=1 Tax=Flavobacterium humidisoli TaxID=2937442 RepID=A0ABY4LT40_9FLAO|nr:hypothetical protein [Flavobacterium humidisoli]UPZ16236.1 hypothetical protein M0M44_02545 [Flavobacterium humidisoli]
MKNLSLWVLIITILSISCTNDFTADSELKEINSFEGSNSKLSKSNVSSFAKNSLNLEIDQLLSQFYDQSNFDAESIIFINQAIHPNGNTTVTLVTSNLNLTNSSIDEIRNAVGQSQGLFELNVENPSMTLAGKASLSDFIESTMQFNNVDYESMLDSIALYQSNISTDNSYSSEDKCVILAISSIAASSIFYEKKREDKDWETAVGNKVDQVTFKTVRMALLSGIIQNNL